MTSSCKGPISSEASPVKELQEDYKPGGRLFAIDLTPTEHHFVEMDRLLKKYVASLVTNINNRSHVSVPIFKAFSIFDVMTIPSAKTPGFKEDGENHIKILAHHFFAGTGSENKGDEANVNTERLNAKWGTLSLISTTGNPSFQMKSRN